MRGTRRRVPAAVLVAVVLIGAGCTHKDRPSARPPGPDATRPAAAAGALRLAVPQEPATLNPFDPRSRSAPSLAVLGVVLPQLFQVDPAGHVVGSLAEDGSVAELPGTTGASFSLRPGAKWSDGAPITADDLRFTLEVVRGEAWPGSRAGYDRLTGVEGDGSAVRFRFDGPFPGWRRLFSGADFVLPAHRLRGKDLKAEWKSGPDLSGGPFLLGALTPGLEVVLDRNEQWWGGRAKLKSLHVLVVPDTRTMEQLLAGGEVDLAWPPADTNRIGRFKAVTGVDVAVAKPGGRVELLVANTESLAQPQRAALLGLPDRDRFVDVLLAGEAERATTLAGPAGAGVGVAAAAGGPTWAQVKAAPDDQGREKGVSAAIVAAEEDEVAPLLGRVLESRAFVRGANLELKFADGPKVSGSWLPEGRFDLAILDDVEWPDPCWRCQFGDGSIGRGNVARVKGVEALAAAAERGDVNGVAALEAKLRQDSVLLPLWRASAVLAARGMKGVVANSWSIGPFWRAEDWSLSG